MFEPVGVEWKVIGSVVPGILLSQRVAIFESQVNGGREYREHQLGC